MEKIVNRQKRKPIVAIIIKKAGYNQKEIADLIGVRENYFNRSINKDPVPAKLLAKIADVLGVMSLVKNTRFENRRSMLLRLKTEC